MTLARTDVRARTSCPAPPEGCGAVRPHMCRTADGRTRNSPHPARRQLADAIEREESRRRYGPPVGSMLYAPVHHYRPTAWHAGRAWDRDEAEALRLWLRTYGPILWESPPAVPRMV